MKDIEDRIKEKYDEEKVPDYMFDTSRVFKRVEEEKKFKKKIISIAAGIVVILITTVTLLLAIQNNTNKDEIDNKVNSINVTSLNSIDILNKEVSLYNENNSAIICTKIDKIEDYCFIDKIPYTKVKATVINCYLGNLENQLEIYIPGGVFKVKDLKDNIKEEINNIEQYNDEDYLKVTYHKLIFIPRAEENKTYITTLKEVNGEYFVDMDKTYGFKEYDPETNIVKYDTGDEILEMDKYLENINI